VGKVVVESALLENVLELAIWQLEGLSPVAGFHQTLHMGFRTKSRRFMKAAKQKFPSPADRTALAGLMKDLRAVGKQRGFIVHGSWAWGTKSDTPWLAKYRKKKGNILGEMRPTKPESIELIAANVSQACDNLISFLLAHGVEAPPLPNTPEIPSWKDTAEH